MPARRSIENKHAKKRVPTTPERKARVTAATFPAPEKLPGQSASRKAFAALQENSEKCQSWWDAFIRLSDGEFHQWRIYAYVAWASSPYKGRWPATLKELCSEVLNCSTTRLHRLRRMYPDIEKMVAQEQIAPLMLHRGDVIAALIDVASMHETGAHSDRKLFLELIGDYKPKSAVDVSGEIEMLSPEEIERRRQARWQQTAPALAAVLGTDLSANSAAE